MLGRLSSDSLRTLATAAEVNGQSQRCVVSFYLGEEALFEGQESRAASLFDDTRATCPRELNEHRAAVAELRRMARAPLLTERPDSAKGAQTLITR